MSPNVTDLHRKRDQLLDWMSQWPGVAVAWSGGVDSTVVAAAALRVLGERAVAITADSPSVPRRELQAVRELARHLGIRHHVVVTREFTQDDYRRNDGSRCYHCKSELYSQIERMLPSLGVSIILSGANRDDAGDYRPGLTAAAEHGVRHPLQEVGFGKAEVRALAREWQLPVWDKPASPCLSSRLAPGVPATAERTARVEAAEDMLHALGLSECRVRLHEGELARIEVPAADIARLAEPSVRSALAQQLRALGFRFVTLDLEGFRSGSLNELVPLDVRQRFE